MSGIVTAMSAIMAEVGAVRKGDFNEGQRFSFRGIDAVVNAVSPALRKHGVVVFPTLESYQYETVEIGRNRTQMGHVRVTVGYTFMAEDGSTLTATVAAEAMDSGDKATAKAMSVAFRTALLQALCLPTDEPDPDSQSYERSASRPLMTQDVYERALAAVNAAEDEAGLVKILAHATTAYEAPDEWWAALGEAADDRRALWV